VHFVSPLRLSFSARGNCENVSRKTPFCISVGDEMCLGDRRASRHFDTHIFLLVVVASLPNAQTHARSWISPTPWRGISEQRIFINSQANPTLQE
jgi:hypothetical protein